LATLVSVTAVGQTVVAFDATIDKGSKTNDNNTGNDNVTKNGITIEGIKGTGTNGAVFGNGTDYRIYNKSSLVISSSIGNITDIVIVCTNENYGPLNLTTMSPGRWYNNNGATGRWEANGNDVSSVTFNNNSGKQTRIKTITVTIEVEGKTDPVLAFPESSYNIQFQNSGSYSAVSTANPPSTGAITYSWPETLPEGTTAIYNSSTGQVDISAGETEGSFTLTASIAETDEHASGTATATIRIIDTRKDPDLKWSTNSASAILGEDFTAPTLSNKSDATPTFESSDPNVATIDATGNVTILAAGTTTITASVVRTDTYKAATASYTLTVTEPIVVTSEGVFALVRDLTSLHAGDKLIVTNYNNPNNPRAISTTQNNNNRGAAEVTFTSHKEPVSGSNLPALCYISEGVQILTLEGDASGWYFNTGNGYLVSAANNNNYLRTSESTEHAKVTITNKGSAPDKIITIGDYARNMLRYNTSNHLFSCYADENVQNTQSVAIYKQVATITETRAKADGVDVPMLLDGSTVLNVYVDDNSYFHAFIRDGKNKNQAIEVVAPSNNGTIPAPYKKGNKLSGFIPGVRQTSETVDRLYNTNWSIEGYNYGNTYVTATEGGDISPIELSSTDNIGDYSCNYVKLKELDVTTGVQIGGLPLNDPFGVASKYSNPYVGASVDVTGIAYLTNNTEILPIELSGSNNTSNSPYTYVFNEMKTLVQPTEKYEGVPARLVRKFYSDGWNTLRLPFHVETARFNSVFGDDVVAVTFSGLSKDEERNALLMRFDETGVTTPGNNMNLLVKVSNDIDNPEFDKVTIDPLRDSDRTWSTTIGGETYSVTFRGILEPTQIAANDGTKLFLGSSGNELVYASTTNNLRATRCYFDLSFNILEAETNTAFFEIGGETVTTIDGIPVANFAKGHVYSIQGQYMGESTTNLPKGLYIVNGKKMVIK
jgi:hypothetical protein